MSIEYTTEEYLELINVSPAYNIINAMYFMIDQGHAFDDVKCTDMEACLRRSYSSFAKLMYDCPIEGMPLFINSPNEIVRSIIMWRLKMNK